MAMWASQTSLKQINQKLFKLQEQLPQTTTFEALAYLCYSLLSQTGATRGGKDIERI